MGFQNIWYSHPRKYGQGSRSCRACSNRHGLIRKYGLNICRQCFREYAADIGFKKVCFIWPYNDLCCSCALLSLFTVTLIC
ncbi:unnamed protein product [Acanthoscelides obtectus]|uniref:Small ribosomal subunit protein uS14 n=1 Tax=Acanthoscelides obtectus TaxID=200917 RepID=A0A9P0PHW9_ACAOB|nr:unnamed protein product [Acanthoscelides obtectus]CAK1657337.1 40S ribosomal protein S29 [Acanthoscelides obtectus]